MVENVFTKTLLGVLTLGVIIGGGAFLTSTETNNPDWRSKKDLDLKSLIAQRLGDNDIISLTSENATIRLQAESLKSLLSLNEGDLMSPTSGPQVLGGGSGAGGRPVTGNLNLSGIPSSDEAIPDNKSSSDVSTSSERNELPASDSVEIPSAPAEKAPEPETKPSPELSKTSVTVPETPKSQQPTAQQETPKAPVSSPATPLLPSLPPKPPVQTQQTQLPSTSQPVQPKQAAPQTLKPTPVILTTTSPPPSAKPSASSGPEKVVVNLDTSVLQQVTEQLRNGVIKPPQSTSSITATIVTPSKKKKKKKRRKTTTSSTKTYTARTATVSKPLPPSVSQPLVIYTPAEDPKPAETKNNASSSGWGWFKKLWGG